MTLRARLKLAALVMVGLLAFARAHAQGQSGTAAPTISLSPPSAGSAQGRTGDGAAESATDLAKKLQNPVGDLISIPFQNNTNFNVGPNKGTQDILNIQPVIPIHLNENWNLITRTILPLVWSPSLPAGTECPVRSRSHQFLSVPVAEERSRWMGLGRRANRSIAHDHQ